MIIWPPPRCALVPRGVRGQLDLICSWLGELELWTTHMNTWTKKKQQKSKIKRKKKKTAWASLGTGRLGQETSDESVAHKTVIVFIRRLWGLDDEANNEDITTAGPRREREEKNQENYEDINSTTQQAGPHRTRSTRNLNSNLGFSVRRSKEGVTIKGQRNIKVYTEL